MWHSPELRDYPASATGVRMLIVFLFSLLSDFFGKVDVPEEPPPPTKKGGEVEMIDVSAMPHFAPIRAGRAKIKPITKGMVEPVRIMYNKEFGTRSQWARNCLEKAADFDRVERKTLYRRALLLGKALHESMGCQMIPATNGDGGQGYAQVTTPTPSQKKQAAAMLGLKWVKDLKWKSDPDHHLALATVMFDDCEQEFGRRDLALLCYNMGGGGVRKVLRRKLGWSKGKPYPELPKVLPHIWNKPKKGMFPDIYVQRVLAGAVMMQRIIDGKELRRLGQGELTLTDIPGWNPAEDGDQFLHTSLDLADSR